MSGSYFGKVNVSFPCVGRTREEEEEDVEVVCLPSGSEEEDHSTVCLAFGLFFLLFVDTDTYTSAWGNRTLLPYTIPFLTPFTSVRTSWYFGSRAIFSSASYLISHSC